MDRQHQPRCLFDSLLRLGHLSEGFLDSFPSRKGVSGSWNAVGAGGDEEQIAPSACGLGVDPTAPISWSGCGEPGLGFQAGNCVIGMLLLYQEPFTRCKPRHRGGLSQAVEMMRASDSSSSDSAILYLGISSPFLQGPQFCFPLLFL